MSSAPHAPVSAPHLRRLVVTMDSATSGWERLAPGGADGGFVRIGSWEVLLNPSVPVVADYWIVFANARPCDRIRCAPENTLFIAGEPAEKKVYPLAFYRQFHRIIDTHEGSGHPRITRHAPCLSWHVGLDMSSHAYRLDHAALTRLQPPRERADRISVVCSDAAFTEGQRERLRFLEALKRQLGDRLAHFGRGFTPVDDKLDAILGSRFHLVLENCRARDYWTEKISDAYLGWAFPFYIGCPNLGDYFPQESFVALDIADPAGAAAAIAARLDVPLDPCADAALAEARRRVLDVHNPWVAWARWAEQFHQPAARAEWLTIRSHKAFRPFPRGLLYRMRSG
jgi:Glycosyltransferase family 10 (fucosyltransferase) C-term